MSRFRGHCTQIVEFYHLDYLEVNTEKDGSRRPPTFPLSLQVPCIREQMQDLMVQVTPRLSATLPPCVFPHKVCADHIRAKRFVAEQNCVGERSETGGKDQLGLSRI
jgi:hypothetical protein